MHAPKVVDVLTPQAPSVLPYRLMLTSEHASQLLPSPWRWPDEDRRLINTHWALDLGAEELTRELSAAAAAPAVLAQFSRLLVDANRPADSPTLFRATADGAPVHLNQELTDEEKEKRLATCYRPYHRAVSELQRKVMPDLLLSLHSYTNNYEGQTRKVEVGVLYNEDEALAQAFHRLFVEHGGYDCRLNEPWSGKEGFMFSADRHAHWDDAVFQQQAEATTTAAAAAAEDAAASRPSDVAVIMLEMKNDLLTDRAWRTQFMQRLLHVLRSDEVVALVQAKKTKTSNSSNASTTAQDNTSPSSSS